MLIYSATKHHHETHLWDRYFAGIPVSVIEQQQKILCLKCKLLILTFCLLNCCLKSLLHLQSCWYLSKKIIFILVALLPQFFPTLGSYIYSRPIYTYERNVKSGLSKLDNWLLCCFCPKANDYNITWLLNYWIL